MTCSFPPKRKKKKKFSNNRQIVAGLPEGKLESWGKVRELGGMRGLGTKLLKAYWVPGPQAAIHSHPTVGADVDGE